MPGMRTVEAAWNSEVHSETLQLAFKVSKRLYSTAMLPRPRSPTCRCCRRLRLVQCVHVLDLSVDRPLHNQVAAKLRQDGAPSISHAATEYIRFYLIAVSIETKRGAAEGNAANLQLPVCVSAHLRRL